MRSQLTAAELATMSRPEQDACADWMHRCLPADYHFRERIEPARAILGVEVAGEGRVRVTYYDLAALETQPPELATFIADHVVTEPPPFVTWAAP